MLTTDRDEAKKKIQELQRDYYADHEYTVKSIDKDGQTLVMYGRPSERSKVKLGYWFHVIMRPNLICIYGDLGDIMILPRGHKTVAEVWEWVASCVDSSGQFRDLGYMTEKVPNDMREACCYCFDEDDAVESAKSAVRELIKDKDLEKDAIKKLGKWIDDHDISKERLQTFLYEELAVDFEYIPTLRSWNWSWLHQLALLVQMVTTQPCPIGESQ